MIDRATVPAEFLREHVEANRTLIDADPEFATLGDDAWRADRFLPARNAGSGRRFVVDPYDQLLAFRMARREQKHIVALCHSHPGGETMLSDEDRHNASKWEFLQVVVALASPDAGARAAAWLCIDGEVCPVRIEVPGSGSPCEDPVWARSPALRRK